MICSAFAFADNPSLLLEKNVSRACLGQVEVTWACCCQTTSKHSLTFGELRKDFYQHAKLSLGTKNPSECLAANRIYEGCKNKALLGDGYINKSGDQFLLFICSIYEKRSLIHWERLLKMPHMGSNDKHNIAVPASYCKSDSVLCGIPTLSLIYSGCWAKIIYHKCNKSPHTVNRSILHRCHQFFKDTNLP